MTTSFLRPDATEKLLLKAKQAEQERQKKAAAKVNAESRKRKRVQEVERMGAIAKSLVSAQPVAATDRAGLRIDAYLSSPPWFGTSEKSDKERVKTLCGRGRWDPEKRCWGTFNLEAITQLINSKRWTPFGIESSWIPRLLAEVQRRVALTKEEEARAEQQTPEEEGVTFVVETLAEKTARRRAREIGSSMVPPTALQVEECVALGLTQAAIEASIGFAELGPRVGMSTHGRLLRWIMFVRLDVRHDRELGPEIYKDPEKLRGQQEHAVAELVASLNARTGFV